MSSLTHRSHITVNQVIAVGFGGMIGSLLRYSLSVVLPSGSVLFPYDTLTVNLFGSFLLAFILSLSIRKVKFNQTLLTFLTTGILGSFTTFSTIMIDFIILLNQSFLIIIVYLLITFLGGFTATILGLLLGQRIWFSLNSFLLVSLGGFIGAISRFFISTLFRLKFMGTLFVNFTGSISITFLYLLDNNKIIHNSLWIFLGVGFFGAYTTFSTFSYEVINLIVRKKYVTASLYVISSIFLSLFSALIILFLFK